jgi:hypoxanthine phosphoribosyltransferase
VTREAGQVFLPAAAIAERVADLAAAIDRDHRGAPLALVTVLKGAVMLCVDLSRALTIPHRLDTIQLSPYRGAAGGDRMRLLKDLDRPVRGEHVVVIEDVIDTGLTLHNVLGALRARGPVVLDVCALLDRPHRRLVDVDLRYVGFTASERPVVGYGLGHHDRFRTLPDIRFLAA